jgi:hypothetical protein
MRLDVVEFPVFDDELPSVMVDFVGRKVLPALKMGETELFVGAELSNDFFHGCGAG